MLREGGGEDLSDDDVGRLWRECSWSVGYLVEAAAASPRALTGAALACARIGVAAQPDVDPEGDLALVEAWLDGRCRHADLDALPLKLRWAAPRVDNGTDPVGHERARAVGFALATARTAAWLGDPSCAEAEEDPAAATRNGRLLVSFAREAAQSAARALAPPENVHDLSLPSYAEARIAELLRGHLECPTVAELRARFRR